MEAGCGSVVCIYHLSNYSIRPKRKAAAIRSNCDRNGLATLFSPSLACIKSLLERTSCDAESTRHQTAATILHSCCKELCYYCCLFLCPAFPLYVVIFVVRPVWTVWCLLLPLKSFGSQRSRFHSSLKLWWTVFLSSNLHSAETWKYLALFLVKPAVWWVVWRFLRYVNIIPCYKLLYIPSSCVLMQNTTVNSGILDLFSGLGCSRIQRGAESQCFWDVAGTAQPWCRCKPWRPMSDLRSLHSSVIKMPYRSWRLWAFSLEVRVYT